MKPKLLSVKQVAEILNISPRTIYNRISGSDGRQPFPIKHRKIGNMVRFLEEDVINFCLER